MWWSIKAAVWVSGSGIALCAAATLASLAAFGYQGEGWIFMLPALPLGALFLVLSATLFIRRLVRRSRHP